MGTEFENLVDGLSGQVIWLAIQEWVERIPTRKYGNLEGTVAYVVCGVKLSQGLQHIFLEKLTMDILTWKEEDQTYIWTIVGWDQRG